MRMKKCVACLLFAVLLVFSACGQTQPGSVAAADSVAQAELLQAWRDAAWFHYDVVEVPHGEDYAIQWEDAGMEAHIRYLLDRPEGDIFHSDVWDVQVLALEPGAAVPCDILLEEPTPDYENFCFELVYWEDDIRTYYSQEQFPAVTSLQDLRHFDSLQIFYGCFGGGEEQINLSGIAECAYLKKIEIADAQVVSLEPLSGMDSLEMLYLSACGSIDLTPIENLSSLDKVSLANCEIASLEPLTTLPQLRYLRIGLDATYPDLEPLERTTVEYLDMIQTVSGRKLFEDMDYSALAQMPNLVYLNLTNHMQIDIALCEAILSGSPNLKYFIVDYTPAAEALSSGTAELNTGSLTAFSYLT